MPLDPLRPLSVGEILDGTFTLYRRHFLTLFGSALIPFIPVSLLTGWFMTTMLAVDPGANLASVVVPYLVLFVVSTAGSLLALAAVTRQVSGAYTGEAVSIGDGYRHGLRAILPLVGVAILAYLALLGPVVLAGIVLAIAVPAAAAAGGGVAGGVVGIVLGAVGVLVALGTMPVIAAGLFGVVPAVVVERLGPIGALRRSWRLSKGARLRIVGLLSVSWVIMVLPWFAVGMFLGVGMALFSPESLAAGGTVGPGLAVVQNLMNSLVWALTFPFFAGCLVLQYYDRRIRTEGYDVEVATEALAASH